MKVYISGAITGADDYVERFKHAEERLRKIHFYVYNPVDINQPMVESGATYESLMENCLKVIDKVDAVYMLHGWEKSLGANREYGYALASGKYIMQEDAIPFMD